MIEIIYSHIAGARARTHPHTRRALTSHIQMLVIHHRRNVIAQAMRPEVGSEAKAICCKHDYHRMCVCACAAICSDNSRPRHTLIQCDVRQSPKNLIKMSE